MDSDNSSNSEKQENENINYEQISSRHEKKTVKHPAHTNIPNKKVTKNDISNPIGQYNYGDAGG